MRLSAPAPAPSVARSAADTSPASQGRNRKTPGAVKRRARRWSLMPPPGGDRVRHGDDAGGLRLRHVAELPRPSPKSSHSDVISCVLHVCNYRPAAFGLRIGLLITKSP